MKRFLLTSLVLCLVCSILEVYGQGSISGPSSVCLGSGAVYSVSGSSATSGYTWNVPNGSSITSGQGSDIITVSFGTAGSGFYVYVTGNGLNANESVTVIPHTPTPGSIAGPSVLCPGGSATFSSSISTPYTSVVWYVTNGSATVTPQTSSALVSIPSNASLSNFQVNVFEVNGMCGPGSTVSKTVTIINQVPSTPGSVSGSAQVCLGAQGVAYGVAAVTNATAYVWSVPPGATIVSGQNTNNITVNYSSSSVSGNVSVYGTNCSGNGPSSSLSISNTPIPATAATITGAAAVCPGDQNVAYSVAAITGATGYIWSLPSGGTIASGQNTNSITVNYSSTAVNGNVGVYGTNCTGNGVSSSYAITVKPSPGAAGTITGKIQVCPGETGVPYSIPTIANATGYAWSLPTGATITSGQNTNSIVVNFSSGTNYGNISVVGTGCGAGNPSVINLPFGGKASAQNVGYDVDEVTGTLSASLPLFTIQSGDIQVPGVLSYAGAGVRVQDDDGLMGHNWNISTQSYGIFRDMRNLPDDYFVASGDVRRGWLFGPARTTISTFDPLAGSDNNPATCADEGSKFTTLNGLTYAMDTEPDVFHVSAPGLSVDFYFDEIGVPHTVPLQDLVITPYTASGVVFNGTTGPITYFTVVDAQGVTYTFGEIESVTENMYTADQFYFVRQTNQHVQPSTYTTGWRLSNIKSPVYGSVDIAYTPVTLANVPIEARMKAAGWFDWVSWQLTYNYHYPLVTSNIYGAGSTLAYQRSSVLKILSTISSETGMATFAYVPKSAGSLMQRLNTIRVYDKRSSGLASLVRQMDFSYASDNWQDPTAVNYIPDNRVMLAGITLTAGCSVAYYGFEYNNNPMLPTYDSPDKDDWGYYKTKDGSYSYDETVAAGSLHRISQPLGGYSVFFYQSHDYVSGGTAVKGGGIRVQKIITYDGVSSANDLIQQYSYTAADGVTSSGKLQHRAALSFSVAEIAKPNGSAGSVHYADATPATAANAMFTLTGNCDMSHPGSLNGSMVAYAMVTVKTNTSGQRVYEYDLPASADDLTANNGEWNASKVYIARPTASPCLATPNITEGYNQYPFPPNPNYDFARGTLRKVTDFDVNNVKVRDVTYTYQHVFGVGNTGIRKIYGLALEELPSYPSSGASTPEGKMFLYSRYEIFTDVKTVLSSQTETVYNAVDLSQNEAVTTNYFYDSPYHRELTRTEVQNSDGSVSRSRLSYTKDYPITTPSGTAATALVNLKNAHRMAVVENLSTKIIGIAEKYMGAGLTLFQTVGGIVYPDKQYTFVSPDGSTFTPASISGGSFQYDQSNYVQDKAYLSFDGFGNPTSVSDKSRITSSVAYGYYGTVPIL